ncbi:MAG: hypothetical protein Q4C58_14180 [Eubacteriales bacterium]|nr:hypothetical protein [Eubacteriales bacterium]
MTIEEKALELLIKQISVIYDGKLSNLSFDTTHAGIVEEIKENNVYLVNYNGTQREFKTKNPLPVDVGSVVHVVHPQNNVGAKFLLEDIINAEKDIYTHPAYPPRSSGLYKITVDKTGHISAATAVTKSDITALGIPSSDTDTHYISKNVVGAATATSNTTSALTNGNVYLNSVENGAVTSSHKISGSGATKVTSDASGNILITSTDTNTTYTSLKNPYAIDINGVSYDGSAAKDIDLLPFIVGTQTAVTGSWTGNAPTIASLFDGLTIRYWLPYAGSGNATLNLTLADGTATGAVNCYYSGTTRLSTHYAAGNVITLTYRSGVSINGSTTTYTGWWADANCNGDTKVTQSITTTANYRSLLLGSNSSAAEGFTPTTVTNTAYAAAGLYAQPSTGTLYANTFKGSLTGNVTGNLIGNAATATKLATARTISIGGGAIGTATAFNGSANITIPVTSIDAMYITVGTSDALIIDGDI